MGRLILPKEVRSRHTILSDVRPLVAACWVNQPAPAPVSPAGPTGCWRGASPSVAHQRRQRSHEGRRGAAMCLPLITQVQTVDGTLAQVRLLEGEEVLLGRGLSIEVIAPEQVEEMLQFFPELTGLWSREDAAHA